MNNRAHKAVRNHRDGFVNKSLWITSHVTHTLLTAHTQAIPREAQTFNVCNLLFYIDFLGF